MTSVVEAWAALVGPWLQQAVGGDTPFAVEQLVAGHSNLVVSASRGDQTYVVRRPPAGTLAEKAHDVLREARVLQTLESAGAGLVPRVVATASAEEAVGPCYAMTRLPGEAVRSTLPSWLDAPRAQQLSADLVDVLAALHALPVEPFLTARLGRPEGYLDRQLALWSAQRDTRTAARRSEGRPARDLPDEPVVRRWLVEQRPVSPRLTLVHGDYKLDNTLVDPATGAVTAVLDWEMATVGDPLADLGFLLAFWPDTAAEVVLPDLTGSVTTSPGFARRAELAARYAERTGADLGHLEWYRCLALWKVAVLLEASYGRFLDGDADDPYFATLEHGVPALLRAARALTG